MQLKIYSDCFGKAGGKIFPQSVRLDDIKSLWYRETRARARQDAFSFLDMPGQRVFFFGFRDLGSFGPSCRGSRDWRGIPFFSLLLLFFWSLACSSPVCRFSMWTPVPRRLAERKATHTHTHVQIKLAAACRLKPNCCTCVIFCWLR